MSKLCWKCNRPHEDGLRVCPYCGASFATDEETYQSDGRSIATPVAPEHYPTTYKKSHSSVKYVLFAVVVFVAAIAMFSMFAPQSGTGTTDGPHDDISSGAEQTSDPATHAYNWKSTIVDDPYSPGYKTVTIEMGVKSLSQTFDTTDFDITLESKNWASYLNPVSQTCDSVTDTVSAGKVVHYKAVFKVSSDDVDTIKLQTRSYSHKVLEYNGSISVR